LILAINSVDAREVTLSWEPFENVLGYHIYISKTAKFKKIIKKKGVRKPHYTVDLPMGTYFYKVRAVDKKKRPGYWSDPEKIVVLPYPPELKLPKNGSEYSYFEILPKIEFEWKPTEGQPVYELFVYRTTGKKALELKTKKPTIATKKLDEGEYMWKVRTIYKGIYESPYCEPRRILVEKKPLTPPEPIEPIKEKAVPAYRSVPFSWKKDENTHFSDIKVLKPNDPKFAGKSFSEGKNLEEEESWVLDYAEPGEYRWTVTTKEGKKTKGITSEEQIFRAQSDLITAGNYAFGFGYGYATLTNDFNSTRVSPAATGKVEASSLLSHVHAGYFVSIPWGLFLEVQSGDWSTNGWKMPHSVISFSNRLRFGQPGFNQQLFLGFRQMNSFETVNASTGAYNIFTTGGPLLGTLLTGTVADQFRIEIDFQYFKPTGHIENKGNLNGDHYEGGIKVSWNPYYKFWVTAGFRYAESIYQYSESGSPGTIRTNWSSTTLEPVSLKISFEH
jgi:hypothetical protein